MSSKMEMAALLEAVLNQIGNTKDLVNDNKMGRDLLVLVLGEDSEFPCLYEVIALPKNKLKGGKK